MRTIPLPTGVPYFSVTIDMEGEPHTLTFKWMTQASVWVFDLIADGSMDRLVMGQRFVLGVEFLEPYNFKIGGLAAIATTEAGVEAGRDDLGVRVFLIAYSQQEIDTGVPDDAATV